MAIQHVHVCIVPGPHQLKQHTNSQIPGNLFPYARPPMPWHWPGLHWLWSGPVCLVSWSADQASPPVSEENLIISLNGHHSAIFWCTNYACRVAYCTSVLSHGFSCSRSSHDVLSVTVANLVFKAVPHLRKLLRKRWPVASWMALADIFNGTYVWCRSCLLVSCCSWSLNEQTKQTEQWVGEKYGTCSFTQVETTERLLMLRMLHWETAHIQDASWLKSYCLILKTLNK